MQTTLSDEALLQKISAQDVDAFSQLYDRYSAVVYQLILRIIRERTIADELLQETFWTIWKNADQFQHRGAVAAWLMRIARNKCLDELRRQKARPQPAKLSAPDNHAILTAKPDQSVKIEESVASSWMQQRLHGALADLPEEQQVCLKLSYFDGMSQREIAEHLGIPLGTVKTRIRLGVEKLEHLLKHDLSGLGKHER